MLHHLRDSVAIRYLRAVLVLAIALFVLFSEPYNLQVTENTFDLFDGSGEVKAVFIADTQDIYNHPGYQSRVIDAINLQEADIIFIGGDITEVNDHWARIGALGELESRYGVYAVLGNHDYYGFDCPGCDDRVEQELESMGITVLRNEHALLEIDGEEFALIGVDDLWGGRSDFYLASRDIPPEMPKVILAHNQHSLRGADLKGSNLVLSGHTHCGLVSIPFITDFILQQSRFADVIGGRASLGEGSELYVTCGVTPGGVRLFTRPEISVIYLE